jgi:DNA relaxase NicK
MADHSGTVIEAQVDYLTCSAHGEDAAQAMVDYATLLATVEGDKGNKPRPWSVMGFRGWHCGAVEYGQRDKGSAIIRLAGDIANRELTNATSLADGYTRIDLAVTHRPFTPDPYVGPNAYFRAEQFWREHRTSAMPAHHGNAIGGYTFTLGRRGGMYYFREYHKGLECVDTGDKDGAERYKDCWRYELEIGDPQADLVVAAITPLEDRGAYVQTYVVDYMTDHGLLCPFPPDGPRVMLSGFRRRSDADSRLKHLEHRVRPTIDWLRDAGYLERALDALGLSENP